MLVVVVVWEGLGHAREELTPVPRMWRVIYYYYYTGLTQPIRLMAWK
jgi:hypothetical protein